MIGADDTEVGRASAGTTGDGAGCGGFSLIEMLVALTLLAIIMAGMPAAIRFANRATDTAEKIGRLETAATVATFLEEALTRAAPLYRRAADGALSLAFRGEAGSVEFTATLAEGPSGPGLHVFDLRAERTGSGRAALVLRATPYSAAGAVDAGERMERHVLLEPISLLRLRYFGLQGDTPKPVWTDVWTRPDALPQLIEITLATTGEAARPRVLTIAPAASQIH